MKIRKEFMLSWTMQEERDHNQGSRIVRAVDAVEAMSTALFEMARDGNLARRDFDKISLSVSRYHRP